MLVKASCEWRGLNPEVRVEAPNAGKVHSLLLCHLRLQGNFAPAILPRHNATPNRESPPLGPAAMAADWNQPASAAATIRTPTHHGGGDAHRSQRLPPGKRPPTQALTAFPGVRRRGRRRATLVTLQARWRPTGYCRYSGSTACSPPRRRRRPRWRRRGGRSWS